MSIQEKRDKVLEALQSASKLLGKENIVPLIIESIRDGYNEVIYDKGEDSIILKENTQEEKFLIEEMNYYLSKLQRN